MDRTKYEAAHQLYQEQNYRKAARLFLEAADEGTPLENGMAYHGAGNCFMRLKRYHDAIVVYEQALRDDSYQKRGTVENNLANAYLQNGDLSQAIAHFEAALNESSMYEPYKCYQGLAHAYFEQQAYEQAALAYKNAALDERNPNPGAALVNLGLCMMALSRPKSAAEAYSAALGVEGYNNRGKALANLGMAYYASKDYARAQRALEEAQIMHHYRLSPAAAEILADSQRRLGQEVTPPGEEEEAPAPAPAATPAPTPVAPPTPRAEEPAPLVADRAGERDVLGAAPVDPAPTPTAPRREDAAVAPPQAPAVSVAAAPAVAAPVAAPAAAAPVAAAAPASSDQNTGQIGPLDEVDSFYALSDKEIARKRKQELRRTKGFWRLLRPILVVLLVVMVLAGAVAAVFGTGFGIPSTDTTLTRLFGAYNTGGYYESYWTPGSQNISRQMSALPLPSNFTVDRTEPGILSSTAYVTVTAGTATKLKFVISFQRSGLGWKISEIRGDY
ncbi:MAG: tetratricopeptide repeat protein [Actinomycetia bacterium]|nr:tetratricopeptide repeat protein [Actinomycetes bacterium]